jgi:ATP-dependent helicase HrpB
VSPDPLPIDEISGPLLRALRSTQAVAVEAPAGSGAATRIGSALLEAGWGAEREIWVAVARPVAAQLAAEQVARQLEQSPGQRVGYQVRLEECAGAETQLRFVTDRVLLERLTSAERGSGIGLVVLDAFQERRAASELSLMLLRRRLKADAGLRIILLSAADTGAAAAYLGSCPRLRCSEPDQPRSTEYEAESERERPLEQRVAAAVERAVSRALGDVLTFLPGPGEIGRVLEALRPLAAERALDLVALHEEQPPELAARASAPGQRRRVILATSLADSLSLAGIGAVVDSGLARTAEYSRWTDRERLALRPGSRECLALRASRAGEGQVLCCFSEASIETRPEREPSELERLDLTGPLLALYACKVPLSAELWLDAPSAVNVEAARARLERLGLASGDRVTDLGRRASALPVPPRLARVALEGAELGIPRRVSLAVALLAERDMRLDGATSERGLAVPGCDCDLEHLMGLYTAAEAERFAPAALRRLGLRFDRVDGVRRSYEQVLANLTARDPAADEDTLDTVATRRALALALVAGFPDRVAGRCEPGKQELLLCTGHTAQLAPESVARTSSFYFALDVEQQASQLCVRVASPIETSWLIEHAPEGLSERELLEWDAEQESAILIGQLCWGDVVLRQSIRPAYPGIATGVLVERAALEQLGTLFVHAEALPDLVARSELVAEQLPELGLQRVNELGTLGLLHAACARVISIVELRALDWGAVFLEQLSPEQRRELQRQAPEQVVLKGGRRLRVQYARGQVPCIETRLQDFFGMPEGPVVAAGRVPLSLRLLAPNDRAVQVTADLAGFWERDYPGLRRELSRRYPLDAWPEEPRSAAAPPPNRPR